MVLRQQPAGLRRQDKTFPMVYTLLKKMHTTTYCCLTQLLYQWKAAEAILLLPADRATSRTGWAQQSPLLKMDSMDSGRLGTQAASHKFGIHEFKGILSRLGTFNCFPKKDPQNHM